MFAGKKSAQIREILISESAWEEMTCLFAPSIDMEALNDPNGKYRAWNVTGLGVYLVGVAVQTPFIDSGFYSGPFVKMLGGIDISWLIGLVLPAGLYYVLRKAQSAAAASAAISR